MNAPIENEALHGLAGDLAPDWIETGEHHCVWSIVNEHSHPGSCLASPNVPSLASNDAALEFLIRQSQGGTGRLKSMLTGITLDGHADDPPVLFFGAALGL